jgi:hypothetical protein
MKFALNPLGFTIVPETIEDAYSIGKLAVWMKDDESIQHNGPCTLLVNTAQLKAVDKVLPWEGSGLGRTGYIKKLLEK